ncbi:hypothetical protein [Rhodococcus sp. IEGM 1318]|uniref:hypothetical protein n=1 Tax=Rhodococcus sp. IEGM 1318 TaxID=3082226 RepID=UPI0029537480|nr:hypothetical protein [Rhodococcus sp. IEGM 1318]MDV8008627.1 hypothetical protein [Rhodococcus sp. IEGM 1318]
MNEREIDEIRENGWRDITPAGDQIDAALVAGENFSPARSFHPDIRAELDLARSAAQAIPDARWLEERGFTYQHSNLPGRKPLPPNYGNECECCPSDIGHELKVVEMDHAERVTEFRLGLDASLSGPYGIRVVVLVDPATPTYVPPLPWKWRDGSGNIQGARVAFPVMYGYSATRVARQLMDQYSSVCHWAGKRTKVEHPGLSCGGPDWGVLVSAGSTTYVFPTCDRCLWELGKDVTPRGWEIRASEPDGPLSFIPNDGWHVAAGYPADGM